MAVLSRLHSSCRSLGVKSFTGRRADQESYRHFSPDDLVVAWPTVLLQGANDHGLAPAPRNVQMIAAVDIGGTKIAVGMVDENGRVRDQQQCPTDAAGGYAKALGNIERMLRSTSRNAGVEITGIGIGSTGPVYPFTGEFGNVDFFPQWCGQNLVRDLSRFFNVSVAMENDADAAALAEAGWGVGKNKKQLIYVTVGTGIGVGVVLDGQIYRGVDRSHPEIGHH